MTGVQFKFKLIIIIIIIKTFCLQNKPNLFKYLHNITLYPFGYYYYIVVIITSPLPQKCYEPIFERIILLYNSRQKTFEMIKSTNNNTY